MDKKVSKFDRFSPRRITALCAARASRRDRDRRRIEIIHAAVSVLDVGSRKERDNAIIAEDFCAVSQSLDQKQGEERGKDGRRVANSIGSEITGRCIFFFPFFFPSKMLNALSEARHAIRGGENFERSWKISRPIAPGGGGSGEGRIGFLCPKCCTARAGGQSRPPGRGAVELGAKVLIACDD